MVRALLMHHCRFLNFREKKLAQKCQCQTHALATMS